MGAILVIYAQTAVSSTGFKPVNRIEYLVYDRRVAATFKAQNFAGNINILHDAAASSASRNKLPNAGGLVRHTPLIIGYGSELFLVPSPEPQRVYNFLESSEPFT